MLRFFAAVLFSIWASLVVAQDISNPQTDASKLTTGTLNCARTPALTGDVTTSAGSCASSLSTARKTLPTTQQFLSGTGTYTTPANVLWIEILLQGPGGGGAGSGTTTTGGAGGAGTGTCWNTTGAACTTPVYSAGSGGGSPGSTNLTGGVGGTISGSGTCNTAFNGAVGGSSPATNVIAGSGGTGASSAFGNGGANGIAGGGGGGSPPANTGAGGGGAGGIATVNPGGGGGSGAYCYAIINTPAATYTYAVGPAGAAGAAGTSGAAGAVAAAGYIRVIEHYGS